MIFFGKIIKTRGNKGEVVIGIESGLRQIDLNTDQAVVLKSEKYHREFRVEEYSLLDRQGILKLRQIDSIEQAYRLVGYGVYVDAESAPVADKGLVGYQVRDVQKKNWGTVKAVHRFGLNRVLEVIQNDEIIYVPWASDIVKKILEEKRMVVIDPPEGLRDLNK